MASELLAESTTDLGSFFAECRSAVDAELDRLVPASDVRPVSVHQAMRWSLFAGGKRFRPALLIAIGKTLGAEYAQLLRTACAFEMIHTYSLIHDDLPSMDDDDLRRGRPTCHIRFGEATATLAGDGLQALAFQSISEDDQLPPEIRVRVIIELARGAGTPLGMVAGQACDLEAESKEVDGNELEHIHKLKTGALIAAAARSGAIIAGAGENALSAITEYARGLGLLFQITDDLLDVTATAQDLGKTPGKDARAQKATYPALYGIEATRHHAVEIHEQTTSALKDIKHSTQLLRDLADFILQRNA